jgi:hypothetical protein
LRVDFLDAAEDELRTRTVNVEAILAGLEVERELLEANEDDAAGSHDELGELRVVELGETHRGRRPRLRRFVRHARLSCTELLHRNASARKNASRSARLAGAARATLSAWYLDRSMRRPTLLVLATIPLSLAACQGPGNGGGASTNGASTNTAATVAATTPAPTAITTATAPVAVATPIAAANDEPPQPQPLAATNAIAPPGQPGAVAAPALTLAVVPAVGVAKAENGSGAVVAANDPVFLDVHGGVGGQAVGPELSVGQLRFHDHNYPSPGVVRFTCADKSLLPAGAAVALVYGSKRVVVATSLVVP